MKKTKRDPLYETLCSSVAGIFGEIMMITFVAAFNTVSSHFAPMRLHFAITSGILAKVERLIESGVDLNFAAPSSGQTPLVQAVLSQHVEIAVALINAGADVSIAEKTSWRRRPIHLAAAAGYCGLIADMLYRSPGERRQ